MKCFILAFVFAVSVTAFASGEHTPPQMPKSFDQLKALVGTWEGTTTMDGKEQKVKVSYELTSGGTALVEKLMEGTPNEMVSIYHKLGNTLEMTHYCAMGNSPHMQLKNTTPTTMSFEMTKPLGLTTSKEPHMHAVTLNMVEHNKLTQEWTNYDEGKKKGTVVFNFTRMK